MQEIYVKKIDIEAKILAQLATSHIIPAAIRIPRKIGKHSSILKVSRIIKIFV
jgi:glutamine synthetase type III